MENFSKRFCRRFYSILLISFVAIYTLPACNGSMPETETTLASSIANTPEPAAAINPMPMPSATTEVSPTTRATVTMEATSTMEVTATEDATETTQVDATSEATAATIATETSTGTPTTALSPTPFTAPHQLKFLELSPNSQELIDNPEMLRFGVTGEIEISYDAYDAGLPFAAMLNYNVNVAPKESDFVLWQVVRTNEEGIRRTTWEEIELAIETNPGSYWVVGNEPDVRWQDNVTPKRYAEIYHEVYSFIKARDPEAKLVIGGVTQPTPLRRAYLDIVLDTYEHNYGQEMPIDVWNVHTFTLREERDSWGVDIPPGMDDSLAINYEIEDHDDLEILEQNLTEFRSWMAERGYGDKPLIVTEYGILMPEDYGFPPEKVAEFLTGSFRLFQTLSGETGYQPDGGRLVQQWFWFSVYDDYHYPTGNLFDRETGQLTALGKVWADYVTNVAAEGSVSP